MAANDDISRLIEPTLTAMGFELVVVRVHGGTRPRLQVMVEPCLRERGMTVDDCAQISHALSVVLDVADPIGGAYTLEVSSPGIDRPLVRRDDFLRFAGEPVRLETETPIDGRRKFTGRLDGLDGEDVLIGIGTGEAVDVTRVPLGALKKARLAVLEREAAAPPGKPRQDRKRKGSKADGA